MRIIVFLCWVWLVHGTTHRDICEDVHTYVITAVEENGSLLSSINRERMHTIGRLFCHDYLKRDYENACLQIVSDMDENNLYGPTRCQRNKRVYRAVHFARNIFNVKRNIL